MSATHITLDASPVQQVLSAWHQQQDSLDTELTESLAALGAFQSGLDAWQRELASQRDQLQQERTDFEAERATADQYEQQLADERDQLTNARQQIAELSSELQQRTEEFRSADKERSELAAEVALAVADASETTESNGDEQHEHQDDQPCEPAGELPAASELAQDGGGSGDSEPNDGQSAPAAVATIVPQPQAESPVLGSIVAQFSKLCRQRSQGRQPIN